MRYNKFIDKQMVDKMKTQQDYETLQAQLMAIEAAHGGIYLCDVNVDSENIDRSINRNSQEYYDAAYFVACNSAGFRAEEMGLDINELVGKIIY